MFCTGIQRTSHKRSAQEDESRRLWSARNCKGRRWCSTNSRLKYLGVFLVAAVDLCDALLGAFGRRGRGERLLHPDGAVPQAALDAEGFVQLVHLTNTHRPSVFNMPLWEACARPLPFTTIPKLKKKKPNQEQQQTSDGFRLIQGSEYCIKWSKNQSENKNCQERKAKLTLKKKL